MGNFLFRYNRCSDIMTEGRIRSKWGAVSYPQLYDKGSPSFELPFHFYVVVTIFIGNLLLRTIFKNYFTRMLTTLQGGTLSVTPFGISFTSS